MDHLEHFGLARDPFRNEVQLDFWFASRGHVDVGRRLRRCVEQGKELCVLVGEVGSGTTTVARALIEQLDPDRFEAGLLVPSRGVDPDAHGLAPPPPFEPLPSLDHIPAYIAAKTRDAEEKRIEAEREIRESGIERGELVEALAVGLHHGDHGVAIETQNLVE